MASIGLNKKMTSKDPDILSRLTGLETAIESLAKTVDLSIRHTDEQLAALSGRVNERPDWRGNIGLGLTIAGMIAALVIFAIKPIEVSVSQLNNAFENHKAGSRPYEFDFRLKALADEMRLREQREYENAKETAAFAARLELFHDQLQFIDQNGSRKWNVGALPHE